MNSSTVRLPNLSDYDKEDIAIFEQMHADLIEYNKCVYKAIESGTHQFPKDLPYDDELMAAYSQYRQLVLEELCNRGDDDGSED